MGPKRMWSTVKVQVGVKLEFEIVGRSVTRPKPATLIVSEVLMGQRSDVPTDPSS